MPPRIKTLITVGNFPDIETKPTDVSLDRWRAMQRWYELNLDRPLISQERYDDHIPLWVLKQHQKHAPP